MKTNKELRARYIELTEIASKVCDLMEELGVKQNEGYTIQRICDPMWHQCDRQSTTVVDSSPAVPC